MNKEFFEMAEMEIISFDAEDIIRTSAFNVDGDIRQRIKNGEEIEDEE